MKLLFVCTGNICRSPTAEAVMRHHLRAAGLDGMAEVDSAGTMAYHTGDEPDPRAQQVADRRGYEMSDLRARPLVRGDFSNFDLILGMDDSHMRAMTQRCGPRDTARLALLLDYAPGQNGRSVPDPYYGHPDDFETVLDLVELAVPGLLDAVKNHLP